MTTQGLQNILIVDDEAPIRKFLTLSLEQEGYRVGSADSAAAALREVVSFKPDLVILDLDLPDMSGVEVIRKIREWSRVPILVLTVNESETSKVEVLDAGADDYVTKPFGVPELLARLRVLGRNVLNQNPDPVFKSGDLEIDYAGHTVKLKNVILHLTATEYAILKLLTEKAGKVVMQRDILKKVWGPNSVEHTQYLRVYVGHLRKKIEVHGQKFIVTEPGIGYRFLLQDS